ncbi:MAG: hypothetical protein RLZZ127_787, partial [Planctomycetota bacterium]
MHHRPGSPLDRRFPGTAAWTGPDSPGRRIVASILVWSWLGLFASPALHAGDAVDAVLDQAVALGWPETRTARVLVGRVEARWTADHRERVIPVDSVVAGQAVGGLEGIHLELAPGRFLVKCRDLLPGDMAIVTQPPAVRAADAARAVAARRWQVEPAVRDTQAFIARFRPADQPAVARLVDAAVRPDVPWAVYGSGAAGLLLLRRTGVAVPDAAWRGPVLNLQVRWHGGLCEPSGPIQDFSRGSGSLPAPAGSLALPDAPTQARLAIIDVLARRVRGTLPPGSFALEMTPEGAATAALVLGEGLPGHADLRRRLDGWLARNALGDGEPPAGCDLETRLRQSRYPVQPVPGRDAVPTLLRLLDDPRPSRRGAPDADLS